MIQMKQWLITLWLDSDNIVDKCNKHSKICTTIINLKNSREQSVITDNNNMLMMKVDHKGNTLKAILLPKVLRPWIIASTHKFYRQQGRYRCYYKIRATYFWNGKTTFQLLINEYHVTFTLRLANNIILVVPLVIEDLLPSQQLYQEEGDGDRTLHAHQKRPSWHP